MAITALYSAASGMRALDTKLDVLANNLANVNTVGFKRSRTNFEDLLYDVADGSRSSIRAIGGRASSISPAAMNAPPPIVKRIVS